VQNSGKEELKGHNVLIAIFSELDSAAVAALNESGLTRYDLVNFVSHGVSKDGEDEDALTSLGMLRVAWRVLRPAVEILECMFEVSVEFVVPRPVVLGEPPKGGLSFTLVDGSPLLLGHVAHEPWLERRRAAVTMGRIGRRGYVGKEIKTCGEEEWSGGEGVGRASEAPHHPVVVMVDRPVEVIDKGLGWRRLAFFDVEVDIGLFGSVAGASVVGGPCIGTSRYVVEVGDVSEWSGENVVQGARGRGRVRHCSCGGYPTDNRHKLLVLT